MGNYINLANMPGTICMRPDGYTYIIGATDEQNEAFRKRLQNFDSSKLDAILEKNGGSVKEAIKNGDLVELTSLNGVTKIEYGSDLYNNMLHVKGMPGSIFGNDYGYKMQKEISRYMNDFYAGKINAGELEGKFNECCSAMRIYCCQERFTNGHIEEDNKKIVSQVYEIFAKENARAARNANYEEGLKYSKDNGIGGRDDDIVYYNSDYYYKCAETKNIIRNAANSVADGWEASGLDYDKIESGSKLTLDGGFDFNSGWNYSYRNQISRSSIENEEEIPPEDFRFFYKESSKTGRSILSVWGGGCEKSSDVPFYITPGNDYKGQIFNMADIIKFSSKDTGGYAQYNSFMGNISVFTRWYGQVSNINNTAGNVTPGYE